MTSSTHGVAVFCILYRVPDNQRWVPRFFHAFALAIVKQKRAIKREKKSAKKAKALSAKEKSKIAERERKKRKFALFPPSPTGSSVPESKDARRGKARGLE
jgi:hypothetical protein